MPYTGKFMKKSLASLVRIAQAVIVSGAFLATAAQAQTVNGWPNKPVKLVVPSGAGGQTDLFARFVAENLAKVYGQPFIVDNKPGASGTIGAMAVTKAAPDGYSLLFTASTFSIVPAALNPQQPYDVFKDLAPITQVGVGGLFLAVNPDMPIKSVKDMFDLARAHPGKYSYGTTGNGSTAHMIMLSQLAKQGLSMTHIPYKSSAEVLRDLTGGVLQIGWIDTSSSLGMIQSGKVRPIAIGSTLRMPLTPDVPTFIEAGYSPTPDGWLGFFAPAGTPEPIVRSLNAEVNRLMRSEEGSKRLTAMNVANPPPLTPEQFAQRMRTDHQAWRKIVVDNNIKPE